MNLIKDKWIATTKGLKSLEELFREADTLDLAGRPDHVVSNMGLLLAIVQDACSWKDEVEWLGRKDSYVADVLAYLEKHVDSFSLEGGFLQDLSLGAEAGDKDWYSVDYLDISKMKGTQVQTFASMKSEDTVHPAKLAQDIVSYQNYCTSSNGWRKGQPGVSQGRNAYLHSFLWGSYLKDTLHCNVLLEGELASFPKGKGAPSWVCGVPDPQSYMGLLCPMSRRILIRGDLFTQVDGPSYVGIIPPSATVKGKDKKDEPLMLWVDPAKKPWRELPSLLSFMGGQKEGGCLLLQRGFARGMNLYKALGLRCLGVSWKKDAFGQMYSNDADSIDATSFWVVGGLQYQQILNTLALLEGVCSSLGGAVFSYWSYLKCDKKASGGYATKARSSWWAAMEKEAAKVVAGEVIPKEQLLQTARGIFQECCPTVTHRGLMAYSKAIQKLQSEEK